MSASPRARAIDVCVDDKPAHFAAVRLLGLYTKIMMLESELRLIRAQEEEQHANVLAIWRCACGGPNA